MAHLDQRIAANEPSAHNPYVRGSSPLTATNPLKINRKAALGEVKPDVARRIPLTQGKFAIIDEADVPLVSQYRWAACKVNNTFYAATRVNGRLTHMHVLLMGKAPHRQMERDHINGNGLDNRRSNLRFATHGDNLANTKSRSATGFKGVYRNGRGFIATLRHNYKLHYLGWFKDPAKAALAYDAALRELRGPFARLNFPLEAA